MKRGFFIVIEGADNVGKTTLCNSLSEWLGRLKIPALFHAFPNRTSETGVMIAKALEAPKVVKTVSVREGWTYQAQEPEAVDREWLHKLFSDNRWEDTEAIVDALTDGMNVICDRYAFSGVAYAWADGISFPRVLASDTGLPAPDLVIMLQLDDLSRAAERGGYDELFEKTAFQERVRIGFNLVKVAYTGNWVDIQTDGMSLEEVFEEAKAAFLSLFNRPLTKLGTLWSPRPLFSTRAPPDGD